jgi:hypothetical protein
MISLVFASRWVQTQSSLGTYLIRPSHSWTEGALLKYEGGDCLIKLIFSRNKDSLIWALKEPQRPRMMKARTNKESAYRGGRRNHPRLDSQVHKDTIAIARERVIMLGPHIAPFLPILFAIVIPFITCI